MAEIKCSKCGAPIKFEPGDQFVKCSYCDTQLYIDRSGAEFFYAHNKKNLVKGGEHVTMGERIALMGDTGDAKGNPQLHFEYWPSGKEGAAVDPTPLVRSLC